MNKRLAQLRRERYGGDFGEKLKAHLEVSKKKAQISISIARMSHSDLVNYIYKLEKQVENT